MALIEAENVVKTYRTGDVATFALRGVSFAVEEGALVSFVGPSGSGKTTLLNLVGCLDRPSSGRLVVAGTEVGTLEAAAAARFRGRHIGFVFQSFNLLPVLTVFENVEYPLVMVQRLPAAERRRRVQEMLEAVGMEDHQRKRPEELSGGQKQRVAIARALVTRPALVLADEPTANLDRENAMTILRLMKSIRDRRRTTFVFSTHDARIIGEVESIFRLEDGSLKAEGEGVRHDESV